MSCLWRFLLKKKLNSFKINEQNITERCKWTYLIWLPGFYDLCSRLSDKTATYHTEVIKENVTLPNVMNKSVFRNIWL
jgi:hypothetical protein